MFPTHAQRHWILWHNLWNLITKKDL